MAGQALCWDCKKNVTPVPVEGSPWEVCPACKRRVAFNGNRDNDRARGERKNGKLVIG